MLPGFPCTFFDPRLAPGNYSTEVVVVDLSDRLVGIENHIGEKINLKLACIIFSRILP
jgi:predicted methyltransferase